MPAFAWLRDHGPHLERPLSRATPNGPGDRPDVRPGGLKVNGVVAQPYNVYATAAASRQFSAFIFSLGNTTPTSATGLRNLLMTPNKDAGTGSFNRTRYSNPAFDEDAGSHGGVR